MEGWMRRRSVIFFCDIAKKKGKGIALYKINKI